MTLREKIEKRIIQLKERYFVYEIERTLKKLSKLYVKLIRIEQEAHFKAPQTTIPGKDHQTPVK